MKLKTFFRWIGGVILILVLILVGGWLAFVPGAKEPPYQFVSTWGEPGDGPGQFNDPIGIAVVGEVECDELYIVAGHKGQPEIVHQQGRSGRCRRLRGARGRGTLEKEKPPIFGMLQRSGEVVI